MSDSISPNTTDFEIDKPVELEQELNDDNDDDFLAILDDFIDPEEYVDFDSPELPPLIDFDDYEKPVPSINDSLSPNKHRLSLEDPVSHSFVSVSTEYHSMFDGKLKGLYSNPINISDLQNIKGSLDNIRDAYSTLSQTDTDKPHSFIFAYRDQDSSTTQALFAYDEESEKIAIDHASQFFEKNCGYKDFTARWLTDYCNTSSYARNMVRVIAATNIRTGEREVVYVSNNVGVVRYNNLSYPDSNPNPTTEELNAERPLSNIADVEGIITAMTVIGYLSFSPDDLKARNTTLEKSAKVMLVRMNATKDYEAKSEGDKSNKVVRYISGISSNDPLHIRIWHSSTGESMDYSSFAHKQRWSKVNKNNKANGIELPAPAKTLSEKIWVYGSMTNSTYYRMYGKRHLTADSIKHSLLFSEAFLKLFVEISNKQGALSVRRIAGAKDGYHIFMNCKEVLLDGLFRPKNVFELDVSADSNYWQSDFSIFDTMIEGWSNDALCYENWNETTYQYETMQGSYKKILSHWLFTLVASLYFDSTAFKEPQTLRPKTALQSLPLKNVKVVSKGFISSRSLKGDYRETNSADELKDSHLFDFRLGSAQVSLGYSLFEITASNDGRERTYSFFLSSDNNGLFANSQCNNEKSIIIVVSVGSDLLEAIWYIKDVDYALTVAKDAITSSDLAKLKGLDVYDAMREIDKTANSYGVSLTANFSL